MNVKTHKNDTTISDLFSGEDFFKKGSKDCSHGLNGETMNNGDWRGSFLYREAIERQGDGN
jgi:hypothetical protein